MGFNVYRNPPLNLKETNAGLFKLSSSFLVSSPKVLFMTNGHLIIFTGLQMPLQECTWQEIIYPQVL